MDRNNALIDVAGLLAETGDVEAALKIVHANTDRRGDFEHKAYARIATGQADTGDFAGALKTVELIKPYSSASFEMQLEIDYAARDRAQEESTIATIQIEQACDVAGAKETLMSALNTFDQIQDKSTKEANMYWVARAADDISSRASPGGGANATNESGILAEIQAAVQPAIPVIKVSDWLHMLDDDNEYWLQNANLVGIVHCALNTNRFWTFPAIWRLCPHLTMPRNNLTHSEMPPRES